MTAWALLGKGLLLAIGSLAASATLRTLTNPAVQWEEPALVKRWGLAWKVAGGDAAPTRAHLTHVAPPNVSGEANVGFRLGPLHQAPSYSEEESGQAEPEVQASTSSEQTETKEATEPEATEQAVRQAPLPEEIATAMRALRPAIQRCYDTGMVPGRVELTLVISGETGQVLESTVTEASSTARCVQRLGEKLRFAPFARSRITVRLPFSFR